MDKAYSVDVDKKWQKIWELSNIACPEISQAKHPAPLDESFVIMMPPPQCHRGIAPRSCLDAYA
jgi:valyl-tRNA synthetase